MKKVIKSGLLMSLFVIAMTFMGSCSSCSNKQKQGKTPQEFDAMIAHQDSVRAMDVTKAFMDLLQQNLVDSAVNALYHYTNITDTITKLSAKTKENVRQQFINFPVKEYEIETSSYPTRQLATVTYKYKFMDNPTKDPNYPCTVNITLAVREYQGKYYLTLYDHQLIKK